MLFVPKTLNFNQLEMNAVESIKHLIQPILTNHGVFLVDVISRGEQNSKILEIFIDSANGITVDTCAKISRDVSGVFDRTDVVQGKYHLVVSSPGLDRSLKSVQQYKKNLGKKLRVTFQNQKGKMTIEGMLTNCTEEGIELYTEKESSLSLPFEVIVEAKVSLPW